MSIPTKSIVDSDFKLPNGESAETALHYLLTDLGSAEPQARNDALSVFNTWIGSGIFPDDWLDGILLEKSLKGMRYKLGNVGDDSVFMRSYFALLLLELLHHNLENKLFDTATLEAIHAVVTETFLGEQDYRAVIPGKGWAYAIPHICDNFWKLVQAEGLEPHHLERTLEVIGTKLGSTGEHIFRFLEDERLAYVALAVLKENAITTDFFEVWITELTTLPDDKNSYQAIVELPTEQHAAYCNARGFLRSLYFQISFRDSPSKDAHSFSLAIERGIKRLDPGFYGDF